MCHLLLVILFFPFRFCCLFVFCLYFSNVFSHMHTLSSLGDVSLDLVFSLTWIYLVMRDLSDVNGFVSGRGGAQESYYVEVQPILVL